MKCSEKACPFPERRDGLCAQHLEDRAAEVSIMGSSVPLMQEYALAAESRLARGHGARHIGSYKSAEL